MILTTCESTQDLLRRKLGAELRDGEWIAAREQTKGRGRGDHAWVSQKGGIYFSIAKEFDPSFGGMTWFPLIVAGVVRDWVQQKITKSNLQIKWPNDLLLEGKKIAGILCESTLFAHGKGMVIAGIGINLGSVDGLELPSAQGLNQECTDEVWTELVLDFAQKIDQALTFAEWTADLPRFRKQLKTQSELLFFKPGDSIYWSEGKDVKKGVVAGLGEFGELRVNEFDGGDGEKSLFGGEIQRIRKEISETPKAFD